MKLTQTTLITGLFASVLTRQSRKRTTRVGATFGLQPMASRMLSIMTWLVLLVLWCPAARPQSCTTVPSGIAGWWPGDGNCNDIIGANNGTPVGGVTFGSGEVGQAFIFDGTGYVDVQTTPALEPAQQLSVTAWLSASTTGTYRYALTKGSTDSGPCVDASYALYTGDSGGLIFYICTEDNGNVPSPDAGTGVWDGNFHYVVGTYDGSTVRLFVDGQEVGNGVGASGSIVYVGPVTDLLFGSLSWASGFGFTGAMDEVQVYDRALSPGEIQANYNAAHGGNCKGLVFSPTSLNFPRQTIGTTSPAKTVTATNAFALPVTVKSVKTTGDFSPTNKCPVPPGALAPGATCTVDVTFTPTAVGTRTGKLTIVDSAPASSQRLNLTGSATDIGLSVSRLNFGNHKVGSTSAAKTVVVTNDGSVPVNFTGSGITIAGTDPADYVISANTCGLSLSPGASCTVSVKFIPTTTGTRSASLRFNDDGGESPQTVALTGNGT